MTGEPARHRLASPGPLSRLAGRGGVRFAATLAATFVVLWGASGAVGAGARDSEGSDVHSLSFVVARPAGPPVLLQFEVAAESAEAAAAAAERAAVEIVPGGRIAIQEPGGVSAQFAFWSWKWEDSELPVRVGYNPAGAPPGAGPQAVAAGLQQWTDVESSRFAFVYGGVTERIASMADTGPDGDNVISWAFLDCATGCVLGVTSKEATHEVDMVLNGNPEAARQLGVGGVIDWRSVILHELGHMAGLEHSCPAPFGACTEAEAAAVMYYQYRGLQRFLEADDIAGISALYPRLEPQTPVATPGAPSPVPTPPPAPRPEVVVVLEPGWNLAMLPEGTISGTMERLECAAAVYGYEDAWVRWVRGAPAVLQTLGTVETGRSYWVLAEAPCAHVFAS